MANGNVPPTVLVVDDEPLIRWALKEGLGDAGFTVASAADGREALEFFGAGRQNIQAVLLDYRLPDIDGLSLLQRIKLASPFCQVIFMTAFGTAETCQEAIRRGAFQTVIKPFNLDDMVGLVGRALAIAAG